MQNLVATLSEREKELLGLLSTGATNQEIGDHFAISLSTVKFHLTNIYVKLGVRNRSGAAAYALGEREIVAPAITSGQGFTETQIRAAAALLVETGAEERKVVNRLVVSLLAALEGKL